MTIVSNAAKCLECGDYIYSAHRHDYVTCSCGGISVDGGQEYIRRVGKKGFRYEEMSFSLDDKVIEDCLAEMNKMKKEKRNMRGILYGALRKLNEHRRLVTEKDLS